jgi:hypothetical protein
LSFLPSVPSSISEDLEIPQGPDGWVGCKGGWFRVLFPEGLRLVRRDMEKALLTLLGNLLCTECCGNWRGESEEALQMHSDI